MAVAVVKAMAAVVAVAEVVAIAAEVRRDNQCAVCCWSNELKQK